MKLSGAKTQNRVSSSASEELCLLAEHKLSDHLRYFAEHAPLGAQSRAAELSEHWRRAQAHYAQLASEEAGAADHPQVKAWPKSLARHQQQLVALPALANTFNTVPVAFGLVPLKQLVVSQFSITQQSLQRLCSELSPKPTLQALTKLCLPLSTPPSPFTLAYRDEDEFIFTAAPHDARFLGARVFDAAALKNLDVQGHAQAVVALALGYSSNLLNVVRFGNRLVINNGHHRALALLNRGISHAPCLIQVCGSHAELEEAAVTEICEHRDIYFESPRPPLLRDFNNPRLTETLSTQKLHRQLRVSVKIDSRLVAAH